MKANIFLFLAMFYAITLVGQNFTFSSIDKELLVGVEAVIRDTKTEIILHDYNDMTVQNKKVITVLNKRASDQLNFVVYYDNHLKVEECEAFLYDVNGKEVEKFKKKDFLDVSATEGTLYSDDRALVLDFTPTFFPYTIEFNYKTRTSTTAFLPRFIPITQSNISLEKATYTITNEKKIPLKNSLHNLDDYGIIFKEEEGNISIEVDHLKPIKIETLAPNLLNTSLLNWQGRLVREDGSSTWVPLQPDTPSQKLYMLNCKIAEDAQISGKARGQYSDYLAQEQRSKYLGINENGVAEKLGNEKLLVTDVKLDNKNNPYEPLKVEFNFTAEDYLEDINGQLYFSPLLFFAMGENPFKAEERNYPIDYGYPIREKYIINYEIPEGFVVESLPENANLVFGNDTFNFKYLVSNRNNTIQIMMDFLINTSLLSSDKYLDVKKFYQDLIDKEKEKIVLKKA